jgi:hypothetical protein
MTHVVRTTHIQHLIENGLRLAKDVNGAPAGSLTEGGTIEDALEKAAADLRHAAEELTAERLSCKGWEQA